MCTFVPFHSILPSLPTSLVMSPLLAAGLCEVNHDGSYHPCAKVMWKVLLSHFLGFWHKLIVIIIIIITIINCKKGTKLRSSAIEMLTYI
jgi:hypothetical protein